MSFLPHHLLLLTSLICRQRSSFLPSYIIDVRALDEKLLNIIDLQFLHGYYEPTLLILFEPNQTWPG
jgi:cleavage and polyadenylation specificity factor subunit 1